MRKIARLIAAAALTVGISVAIPGAAQAAHVVEVHASCNGPSCTVQYYWSDGRCTVQIIPNIYYQRQA